MATTTRDMMKYNGINCYLADSTARSQISDLSAELTSKTTQTETNISALNDSILELAQRVASLESEVAALQSS